jgi:two-component system LytT family response regulator
MLRAVIIDDELSGVLSLELLVKEFTPQLRIVASTTRPQEGLNLIDDYKPDIVFLDINMPVLNGFELLEKIGYHDFYLIFTTAYSDYGLQALKRNAVDYLLKPIGEKHIREAVERVELKIMERQKIPDFQPLLSELINHRNIKVPLPLKKTIEYVLPNEIVYIEASGTNAKIGLLNKEEVLVAKAIKEYEIILCKNDFNFIRIHNSFIINLNHITRYLKENGGSAVMKGNKSVPISKYKKDQFLKLINLV